MMCVELRAKKLYIAYVQFTEHVKIKLILTHTEHTSTTSPVNETQKTNSMKTKVLFKFGA